MTGAVRRQDAGEPEDLNDLADIGRSMLRRYRDETGSANHCDRKSTGRKGRDAIDSAGGGP